MALPLFAAALFVPVVAGALQASPPQSGEALFRQRCSMCHTVKPGAPAGMGPNLATVAGRKSASTDFSYTPAMKKAGLTWDRRHLNALLTAPAKTVPGSTMVVSVPNPQERAAIVDYLFKLKS
ncbi:hypothetical protein B2G71_08485 [Novosphingobium sp. PC22D]|uniref:c-type cytochrome n=1 Tax=Novosphingobium sp. PC22D TaxID=1962403 RepID=UPI000BFAC9E8|nr:c-type cytochrome [Novosphingobium sp. PC22D]PEQ12875.1 hypothetical protein B2G71_08485 [Novosphingobium sp. PC22D]